MGRFLTRITILLVGELAGLEDPCLPWFNTDVFWYCYDDWVFGFSFSSRIYRGLLTSRTQYGRNKLTAPWPKLLSAMRRFRSKVEAILVRSSLENDRTQSPYTFNVATTSTHNLSGRDFVRQPNETESSFTNTLGVAGTSEVASPSPNYSKHPNSKFSFHFSFVNLG